MTAHPYKLYEERHYGPMNRTLPIARFFGLYQLRKFLFRPLRQWASSQTGLPPVG
jgi:hypothetical protein